MSLAPVPVVTRRYHRTRDVGPYLLERTALGTGPTWADYMARHSELPETAGADLPAGAG